MRAKIVLPLIFSIILILGTTQTAFAGTSVEIDIDPGNDPNFINLLCPSPIPVGLLGSPSFDAAGVDVSTLEFGPGGAPPIGTPQLTDVNADGLIDLLSFYQTVQTDIIFGDIEACLTGNTLDGTPFEGCDSIVTIRNVCAVGGEMFPVDTTALLLAATYSTASWMIPLMIAAVGFGILITHQKTKLKYNSCPSCKLETDDFFELGDKVVSKCDNPKCRVNLFFIRRYRNSFK